MAETLGARRLSGWLLAALAAVGAVSSLASSTPEPGIPGVAINGTVYAALVSGQSLYIGGNFQVPSNASANNLAIVNLATGAVTPALGGGVDGPVYALALSADGTRLYAGGDFSAGGTSSPHHNLAAITEPNAVLVNWTVDADHPVHALALSADGTVLYVGGEFGALAPLANGLPSPQPRAYIGSINTATAAVLPWSPAADNVVRALALDDAGGRLYVGGDFDSIGGATRPRLAMLGVASGLATAWNPAISGARVGALMLAGGTLYVGGNFSQAGGQPRNQLAALNVALNANMATDWNPAVGGGEVRALALVPDGLRLYAGGLFTDVGGVPRADIAGIRTDTSAEAIAWNPGADGAGQALAIGGSATATVLYAGGAFAHIGGAGQPLAAFDVTAPQTTLVPLPGASQQPSSVTLKCTDRSGAGCKQICYTTRTDPDLAFPADYDCVSADDPVTVAITHDSTLHFSSEDLDGNREPVTRADYVIDDTPPTTQLSPPPKLYGIDSIQPVTLTCVDDKDGACATYYTLDGSSPVAADGKTPAANATTYTAPISLSDLFPPSNIPADEVDPLRDLAGTVTLRFFSVDAAGNAETAQSVQYEVDLAPPKVTPSFPGGSYTAPKTLTLTCDDGAGWGCVAVYYTTDNSPPTLDGAGNPVAPTRLYQQPLQLSSATTLNVLAIDKAKNSSTTLIGIYAFNAPTQESSHSGVGAVDPWWLLILMVGAAARWSRPPRRARLSGGSGGCP